MVCYTHLRNVRSIIWWEDPIRETFWTTIWPGPIIPFGSLGWVSPYNFEGSVKNPSIWKESLTWIVPRIRSVRGVNLEGWRTGCRPWGVGDDGRIGNLLEKTQCGKRWYFPDKENLFFQSLMDESNPWRRSRPENIHLGTAATNSKEKVTLIFLENQKGLFHHVTTHFRMPVKRWTIFGPCQETSYTAITLNQESNFTRREKNHSLLRNQNYSYEFGC